MQVVWQTNVNQLSSGLFYKCVDVIVPFWYVVLLSFRFCLFFFSSRRRHTRCLSDWSSDVCSSDLRRTVRQHEIESRRMVPRQLEHPVAHVQKRLAMRRQDQGVGIQQFKKALAAADRKSVV